MPEQGDTVLMYVEAVTWLYKYSADLERLAESKDTMVRHLRSIVRAVYHMMGDISGKVLGLNYGGKVCWNYNQGSLVSSMKRDILTSGR